VVCDSSAGRDGAAVVVPLCLSDGRARGGWRDGLHERQVYDIRRSVRCIVSAALVLRTKVLRSVITRAGDAEGTTRVASAAVCGFGYRCAVVVGIVKVGFLRRHAVVCGGFGLDLRIVVRAIHIINAVAALYTGGRVGVIEEPTQVLVPTGRWARATSALLPGLGLDLECVSREVIESDLRLSSFHPAWNTDIGRVDVRAGIH